MFYPFKPYVSVAARRKRAEMQAKRLSRTGAQGSPVVISGRTIAGTFWGASWCRNIERYSDLFNRLERGRSYVRSGAVVDLGIAPGRVHARVAGTRLYTVQVKIEALPQPRWRDVCTRCAGSIDSVVELLQGRLSKSVMEHICAKETGLFPAPREIAFECSCPDYASMCKHVAAVLYGIGARLDQQPELLFVLRKVDQNELISSAGSGAQLPVAQGTGARHLAGANLSELFGIDIAEGAAPEMKPAKPTAGAKLASRGKGTAKKQVSKARSLTDRSAKKPAASRAAKRPQPSKRKKAGAGRK
jgi:uncharacterized Zn finger protein